MRIALGLAVAAILVAGPACKRKRAAAEVAQDRSHLPIAVQMGDPRAEGQLISGFHGIEAGAWRWTGKQFTIELGTPRGAAGAGAVLALQLTVPAVVIEKNQSVTLSASVDGNVLPPETYTTAGEHIYKRDVPAALLDTDAVKVTFEVDKTLGPSAGDERVLGVIATSAALTRK